MSEENKYRKKRKIGLATFEEMDNQYVENAHTRSPQENFGILYQMMVFGLK